MGVWWPPVSRLLDFIGWANNNLPGNEQLHATILVCLDG
jgi:hypothetical protein